jgi:hypothetical protein
MRTLDLDYWRQERARPWAFGLLAAGFLAVLVLADRYQAITVESNELRETMRKLESVSGPARARAPRNAKETDERLRAARQVVAQLNVPWDRLFRALEEIDEKDVGVLAISPDANKQQVKLQMEAKSLESMLSYHRKLAESPVFSDMALTDHQVVQDDPDKPVRFNMNGTWVMSKNAPK